MRGPRATILSVAPRAGSGTDWYLKGRAGPFPLTHPLQKDGRTWRGSLAAGESSDLHLQFLLKARGRLTFGTAPKPQKEPNQTRASRGASEPCPLPGRGQTQLSVESGEWRKRRKGAPGAGCARVGARLGAPSTPRFSPGGTSDGGSGSRGNQRKQEKPFQSDASNRSCFRIQS